MSVKEDIRTQIIGALAHAKFPIDTPDTLLGSFPDGGQTTCRSGDVVLTVEDAGKIIKPNDFPFKSAKEVANVIVDRAGL